MQKSFKISEKNYNTILKIRNHLSMKAKKRITFDDVVSLALALMRGKRK